MKHPLVFSLIIAVGCLAMPLWSQVLQLEGVSIGVYNVGTPSAAWVVVQPTTAHTYNVLDTNYQEVVTFTLPVPPNGAYCSIGGISPDFDTDSNIEVLYMYVDTTTYRYSSFLRDISTSANQLSFSHPETTYLAYTSYFDRERVTIIIGTGPSSSQGHSWLYRSNNPQGISSEAENSPRSQLLMKNYPNPALRICTVDYELPKTGVVDIAVYDESGRRLKTLRESHQAAGKYCLLWDGTNEHGNTLPSGPYFCLLRADSEIISRKMILLR